MDSYFRECGTITYMKRVSLHWEMPFFSAIIYVLWVLRNNKRIKEKRERDVLLQATQMAKNSKAKRKSTPTAASPPKKSLRLKGFIFLHNMVMSVFSMVVFANTFAVVWNGFWLMDLESFLTDPEKIMWEQLSPWIWMFYISKYYEIVDTVILFATNKESSFLQMYHHAGALIACWLVSLAESYIGWIWVVLNSFIHSLMYLYYGLTVFGIRPPFKRVITFMQIGQFFTGMCFGFVYIFNPKTFSADPTIKFYQVSAIGVNIVYVLILIWLFIDFERQTYRKKQSLVKAPKKERIEKTEITSLTSTPISSVVSSPAS